MLIESISSIAWFMFKRESQLVWRFFNSSPCTSGILSQKISMDLWRFRHLTNTKCFYSIHKILEMNGNTLKIRCSARGNIVLRSLCHRCQELGSSIKCKLLSWKYFSVLIKFYLTVNISSTCCVNSCFGILWSTLRWEKLVSWNR